MERETGIALLARIGSRPDVTSLDGHLFKAPLLPPEIIEVTGPPGSGKTLLCYHLMATALLPKTWRNIELNGCAAGVVFIDCDHHFNILQLSNIMERRVKKTIKQLKIRTTSSLNSNKSENVDILSLDKVTINAAIDDLLRTCLENLLYMRCIDSKQFACTLVTLDLTLTNSSNVSLVVVDSISAFYWFDRVYRANSWQKLEVYYNKIFKAFLNCLQKFNIVVLCTKQPLFKKRQAWTNLPFKQNASELPETSYEFLGKTWSSSITVKISLNPRDAKCEDHLSECTMDQRVVYAVEVVAHQKEYVVYCTYHEDGVRWINL